MVLGGRKGGRRKHHKTTKKVAKRPTPRTSDVQVPMLHSTSIRRNSPLPKMLKANFIYSDEDTLNPGVSTVAVKVYTANGMFDPNITGAGHSPRGFDQLMLLYQNYVVIATHIEAVFCPVGGTGDADTRFGIFLKSTLTAESSWNDYMEQGASKVWKVTSGRDNTNDRLILDVNPNKFLGISHPLSDETVKGSAVANPTQPVAIHFVAAGFSTADLASFNFQLKFDFTAMLIEPKQVAQSG